MRIVPPEVPDRTMFAARPICHRGLLGDGVGDRWSASRAPTLGELEPAQQAAAAHVADAGMPLLQPQQARGQPLARVARPVDQPVAQHDLEDLQADRRGQRIVHVGRVEEVTCARRPAAAIAVVGHHGRQRHAGAQGLGEGQDVRHDAVALEGEHGAGAAEARLRLVEDQQHAASLAVLLEGGEIARRQVDHAAAAQDRLADEGGEIAGALRVDLLEGVVELAPPIDAGKARR